MERDVAYRQRNLDAGPGNGAFDSKIGLPFRSWCLGQLLRWVQRGFVKLSEFVNLPKHLLSLVGDFFFCEIFIIEVSNFLDGAHTFAQAFADGDDFLNDDGRARDGLHDHELPAFDALGEVVIAKRIERGQLVVIKAITRSPIVIKEIIAIGEGLRKGVSSIKEIVQFDDEELTEEKIANKTKQKLRQIEKIAELYKPALKQAEKLAKTPKSKRQSYLRVKCAVARTRIQISLAIRDISFHWLEKKRLIHKIRSAV